MTRAAPTKLSVEKDFRFWPFHDMFMNHIENMGWIASVVFTDQAQIATLRKILDKSKYRQQRQIIRRYKLPLNPLITSKNSNSAASTLGFLTQATNRLKISLPKKATIIIDPDLWPGSYLPLRFYTASNKEFFVHKT